MLYLIRGIPGSGKTTYAKQLGIFHVEADMFHMKDGEYRWDPKRVKQAHDWCYRTVAAALDKGMDVVVSNTFTKVWELEKYLEFDPVVYVCSGEYQNIHNVPEEVVQRMKDRWEDFEGETYV